MILRIVFMTDGVVRGIGYSREYKVKLANILYNAYYGSRTMSNKINKSVLDGILSRMNESGTPENEVRNYVVPLISNCLRNLYQCSESDKITKVISALAYVNSSYCAEDEKKNEILGIILDNVDGNLLLKVKESLDGIKSIVNALDKNGKIIGGDILYKPYGFVKSDDGETISYSKINDKGENIISKYETTNIKELNDMINKSIAKCHGMIQVIKQEEEMRKTFDEVTKLKKGSEERKEKIQELGKNARAYIDSKEPVDRSKGIFRNIK